MLSSRGRRGDAKLAKEAGFAGYLGKPAKPPALLEVLKNVWSNFQRSPEGFPLVTRYTLAEAAGSVPENRVLFKDAVKPRVLVVDDNPVNQRVASALLQRLGCRADVAANGQEAVDILDTFPYDLIFMDCQMPILDGYDATREIRRREAGQLHSIIIAMTANAMQRDRDVCIEAGMDDYIAKPISKAALADLLTTHLPHFRRQDPIPNAAPAPHPAVTTLGA